jgi:hypothetical protein
VAGGGHGTTVSAADPLRCVHGATALRAGGAADRPTGPASLHSAGCGGRSRGQPPGVGSGEEPRGAYGSPAAFGCRGGRRLARWAASRPGGAGLHRSQGRATEPGRFRQVLLPASRRGCERARARASRLSRRSSGMRRPASRSTPMGTCSRPRWTPLGTAWNWPATWPWRGWGRTQHGPADSRLGESAGG